MIGYNLLLDAAIDEAHLRALQPGALVVVSSWDRARAIKELLPETSVSYRHWPDDNIHRRMTPQQWVDAHAQFAEAGVIVQADNEPATDNLPQLAQWYADVMDGAGERGMAVAVGSFSTGNPHHERYHELEPMWRALERWHDLHVWSPHEYFDVQVDRSMTWHVGRFLFGWQACVRLGLRRPRTLIGELAVAQGMDAGRGWKAAGLSETQYADELEKAAHFYSRHGVLGACIFSLGKLGGWDSFDVQGEPVLQQRLIALSAQLRSASPVPISPPTHDAESVPVDDPGWYAVTAQSPYIYSRVRAAPTVYATEVGRVSEAMSVQIAPAQRQPGADDPSYTWMPIRSALWDGWIREDVVAFSDFPAPPTPLPEAPEPDLKPVMVQFQFWAAKTSQTPYESPSTARRNASVRLRIRSRLPNKATN